MVRDGDETEFLVKEAGSMYFQNELCVLDDKELKKRLLFKAHNTVYTMHLGGDKMYQDLKQHYWWKGMKRDVTKYVSKCLTCQQVQAKHQVPIGLLNPLPIPQWKWDNISMDFVLSFPLTQQKHDSFWVIVDRLTTSAHFIPVKIDYSMDRLVELYVDEIVRLHDVFHVSMLQKYHFDESHILPVQEIQVQEDLSYAEEPKTSLAREVKQLWNKQVPLVKVLWQHHSREEATWEPEETMRAQYPQLFESGMNFEDEILLRGGRVVTP